MLTADKKPRITYTKCGYRQAVFFFLLRYDRHELRGGHWGLWFWLFFKIGFLVFVPKNVGFSGFVVHCVSRISVFSIWFSVFVKDTKGFLDEVIDMVLGFSYLGFGFSLIWTAIMRLQWSRIAAKISVCSFDRLGFSWVGCENVSDLTVLRQAIFSFDRNFFFVVLPFWMNFSTVLLLDPNTPLVKCCTFQWRFWVKTYTFSNF